MKQGQKKANQNMVDFPEDVIINILLGLPSKSLVRSQCVSKYWNTLINSPSFIKAHLHRASKFCHLLYQERNCSETFVQKLPSGGGQYYFVGPEEYFSKLKMRFSGCTEFSNLDPPTAITDAFSNFRLVDSFNGIACLYAVNKRASTSRIWLWNPAINDCFVVPQPRFPISSAKSYCVGFGFNPLTSHLGDFKVVSVTLYGEWDDPDENSSSRAEIYSRRTNTWKELVGWFPKWSSRETDNHQVIFEEYICWIRYYWSRDRFGDMKSIVSLNVVSEEFHEIALPDSISSISSSYQGCITLLDGCVSLLASYLEGYEVWTMKEFGNIESWSKLYNIDKFSIPYYSSRPLGFASRDEALFLSWKSHSCLHPSSKYMLSYDTRTRTVDSSKTISFDYPLQDCCLALYIESLISVSYISRLEEGLSSDQ